MCPLVQMSASVQTLPEIAFVHFLKWIKKIIYFFDKFYLSEIIYEPVAKNARVEQNYTISEYLYIIHYLCYWAIRYYILSYWLGYYQTCNDRDIFLILFTLLSKAVFTHILCPGSTIISVRHLPLFHYVKKMFTF